MTLGQGTDPMGKLEERIVREYRAVTAAMLASDIVAVIQLSSMQKLDASLSAAVLALAVAIPTLVSTVIVYERALIHEKRVEPAWLNYFYAAGGSATVIAFIYIFVHLMWLHDYGDSPLVFTLLLVAGITFFLLTVLSGWLLLKHQEAQFDEYQKEE